jgi:hypothetical protein
MSGLARRIKRAQLKEAHEMRGFKRGRALNRLLPKVDPRESFHSQARRFVRITAQMANLRRKMHDHQPPPAGMMDRLPLVPKAE